MIDYKAFLDPISHPNKKNLAIALIARSKTTEELEATYGVMRVKEMKKEITRYKKDPANYQLYKGSCETCGV